MVSNTDSILFLLCGLGQERATRERKGRTCTRVSKFMTELEHIIYKSLLESYLPIFPMGAPWSPAKSVVLTLKRS